MSNSVENRRVVETVGQLTARHALGWLLAANLVGVWLAALLVWPALGDRLAPLTYGRWVPLHLNWQLYGWCALPLVGALLDWCVEARHPQATLHVRLAISAWTLALVAGGVAWLGGVTSGKLFLDWSGWARGLLSVAMVVLWTVCAAHAWWRRGQPGEEWADRLRGGLLLGLMFVPGLLYWSAGRSVYPAINPDSGGATGASLLGSTLGILTIYGFLPRMLGVTERQQLDGTSASTSRRWWSRGFVWALVGSWVVFGVIDHGDASHHAAGQILGLGLLLVWVPLAWVYFEKFAWAATARPWLGTAFGWWLLLVVTGFFTFLPGISERLKFTNALVGHAHLAMAGFVTSVNFAILRQLAPRPEPRGNFYLWQAACAVMVVGLLALGWAEGGGGAGAPFRGEGWTQGVYGLRLAAGLVMGVASLRWWWHQRAV